MLISFQKKVLSHIPVIYIFLVAIGLRFVNLGYSDYQGDEIKALFRPLAGASLLSFLLDQRKGPLQFLITYLMSFVTTYSNEFLMRLPFALAGVFSVLFLYKLVAEHFGKKIALYAAFLLATNGLFVAFSRIVQYQSYVILFSILTLYFFTLAVKTEKWRVWGIYAGFLSWAIAVLFHYDGVFIAPLIVYLSYKWFKLSNNVPIRSKLVHYITAALTAGALVGSFYIPFFLSVSEKTIAYWTDRISGGSDKLSSSIITFKAYNPKLIFYIYCSLSVLSVIRIKTFWPFLLWFLFPWVILEVFTNVPGTHIYTYLMPATVIAAFGVEVVDSFMIKVLGHKLGGTLSILGLLAAALFASYLPYKVFVEHRTEYPWEAEKFLVWELQKPNVIFHLSLFGFPYYRHWEEIGRYMTTTQNNGYYSTNERDAITRYYVPFKKDTDLAGHFVYIHNPQSFTNTIEKDKVNYWLTKHKPDKVFYNGARTVADVYYMPAGSHEAIVASGY